MSDKTQDEREIEHIIATLQALPGYPWEPCPICKGGREGCCHTFPERARAAIPGLVLPKVT